MTEDDKKFLSTLPDTKEEMYEHFKNGLVENPLWGMMAYMTVRVFSEKEIRSYDDLISIITDKMWQRKQELKESER